MRKSYSDLNGESVITVPEAVSLEPGQKNFPSPLVISGPSAREQRSTKQTPTLILFDYVNYPLSRHFISLLIKLLKQKFYKTNFTDA